MVLLCSACKFRARDDGSCKNQDCEKFRSSRSGAHWLSKRFHETLGESAGCRVGAYVHGGFALTLLHRHDIRVGIASGMVLKHFVQNRARRLELLAMLFPCYWRWSTQLIVRAVVAQINEFLKAEPLARANML